MEDKKLKILIGCLLFREYTGSEMYVYELAKNLVMDGHDVSVVSPNTEGPLHYLAESKSIKVYNFNNAPINENFDIIHCQHHPIVTTLLEVFKNAPFICTIHSEVIELENPVISEQIKKYIAIRPEIKIHLEKKFNIPSEKIEVIYNPIDGNRFNQNDTESSNSVLFVGTIDYLRKNTIFDLIQYTKDNKKELWIVGKNHGDYLNLVLQNSHVKYFNDTRDVERFTKKCGETAGILLGRTTIEGWMCGKHGWIYEVNSNGNILNKKLHPVPEDIEKFNSDIVTKKIKELYIELLNS